MHTPWLLRGIHAVIVVAAMTAFGTALFCVAASTGLQINQAEAAVTWICLALPWLVLLASVWGIWKRLRYAITLPLVGVSSAFVIYMAWDDPSRPPAPTIDALVPADSKSYAAYQRFVKDPASADLTSDSALPLFPGNVADWPAFVIEHRTQLEDAWEADTSGQSWIIDMARNKPEGLYPPETYNAPGLSFFKVRSAAQLRWAKFHLLVADGQPNEAAQLLLPLLRASHHLQSAGTTLLNQMVPVVLLKGCYQRLELLADDPGLAAATRVELLAAL